MAELMADNRETGKMATQRRVRETQWVGDTDRTQAGDVAWHRVAGGAPSPVPGGTFFLLRSAVPITFPLGACCHSVTIRNARLYISVPKGFR